MNDIEFFSKVDTMLSETLTVKSLEELCAEITEEVTKNKGKYVDNFKLSLALGEQGERVVRKFLESLGYTFISKSEEISHDYKFIKDGKEYMFEIKTDGGHIRPNKKTGELYETGNMVIEYESRGKNSGIAATKADFFVTYYPQLNEIWLIKTEKLKDLLRENKDSLKRTIGGDSNSETKMFLLNREKFKNNFRITNPYKKELINS
jgi:hypothetical protein